MRRRSKKLEVSTFPFLAVLLCAMGSLILVLLITDRKAKLAARYKAAEALAKGRAEAERTAMEHKALREAARTAERDRLAHEAEAKYQEAKQDLHARLAAQDQEIHARLLSLKQDALHASEKKEQEKARLLDLRRQWDLTQKKLKAEEDALAGARSQEKDGEKQSESTKAQLARWNAELDELAHTLKDLNESRKLDGHTYSVVPYRGKLGDDRHPLYLECSASGVVLHPEKQMISIAAPPSQLRAEVEKRIFRQREQLAKGGERIDRAPYLLLLVRPNGVECYHVVQHALESLNVDFGYEFIDPDWVLDFPNDDKTPAAQPWMATPGSDPGKLVATPARASGTGGMPQGLAGTGKVGGGTDTADGNGLGLPQGRADGGGSLGGGGRSGKEQVAIGTGIGSGGATTGGLGPNAGPIGSTTGAGGGTTGATGRISGPFANGNAPGASGTSGPVGNGMPTGGSATGGLDPHGGPLGNGTTLGATATGNYGAQGISNGGTAPGNQGSSTPGDKPSTLGPSGLNANTTSQGSEPGARSASGSQSSGNAPPNPNGSPEIAIPALANPAAGSGGPKGGSGSQENSGSSTGGDASNYGNATNNGSTANAGPTPNNQSTLTMPRLPGETTSARSTTPPNPLNKGDGTPATGSANGAKSPIPTGSGGGDGEPVDPNKAKDIASRFTPPSLVAQPKRQAPLKPLKLNGDRDWIIYVECRPDSVVLYPSRKEIPLKDLTTATTNPLLVQIQQMITRRQATLRPEEPPYRPQVRFLVRPDSLRAFHSSYPALEALPVPKTRRNLDPEEDAATVAAGN